MDLAAVAVVGREAVDLAVVAIRATGAVASTPDATRKGAARGTRAAHDGIGAVRARAETPDRVHQQMLIGADITQGVRPIRSAWL